MDFEDERFVRLYVRDTPTWVAWRWEARALAPLLLRKLDRKGRLEWPPRMEPARAVAGLVGLPIEVVDSALLDLQDSETIELGAGWLEWSRFVPGQNAKSRAMTGAERTAEWRERKKANTDVTSGDKSDGCDPHLNHPSSDQTIDTFGVSPPNSAVAEPGGDPAAQLLTHPSGEETGPGRTAALRRRHAAELWVWHEGERTRRLCAIKTDPRGYERKDLDRIVRLLSHIVKRHGCDEGRAWQLLRAFRERALAQAEDAVRTHRTDYPSAEKQCDWARTESAWSPKAYDKIAERGAVGHGRSNASTDLFLDDL